MERLTINIPEEVKKAFRIKCIQEGKDLTEKTLELILEYLNR